MQINIISLLQIAHFFMILNLVFMNIIDLYIYILIDRKINLTNIVLNLFNIINFNDKEKLEEEKEVLEELSKEDIVFSLINSRYLSESNLTITNKAYQDNTCFQVFNGDNLTKDSFSALREYIHSLKNIYTIKGVFFVDSLENIKNIRDMLKCFDYETSVEYKDYQYKLIKTIPNL